MLCRGRLNYVVPTASELRVVDGPPEGGPVPMHPEEPQLTSPIGPDGIDTGMLKDIGERLFGKAALKK